MSVDEDQQRYLNMFIGFLDGSLSAGDEAFPSGEENGDEEDDDPTGRHSDPDDPFAA